MLQNDNSNNQSFKLGLFKGMWGGGRNEVFCEQDRSERRVKKEEEV